MLERNMKNLVWQNSHTIHTIECQVPEAAILGHSMQTNLHCFSTRLISILELRSSCVAGLPQCLYSYFVPKPRVNPFRAGLGIAAEPCNYFKTLFSWLHTRGKKLNRSVVSQVTLEEQGPSCAKMSRWKEQMMSLENCDRIFSTTNDSLMFFGLVMQFNSLWCV